MPPECRNNYERLNINRRRRQGSRRRNHWRMTRGGVRPAISKTRILPLPNSNSGARRLQVCAIENQEHSTFSLTDCHFTGTLLSPRGTPKKHSMPGILLGYAFAIKLACHHHPVQSDTRKDERRMISKAAIRQAESLCRQQQQTFASIEAKCMSYVRINESMLGPSKIRRTLTDFFSCWFVRNSIIQRMMITNNAAKPHGFSIERASQLRRFEGRLSNRGWWWHRARAYHRVALVFLPSRGRLPTGRT